MKKHAATLPALVADEMKRARLQRLRRRVRRAMQFPVNTCGASRHVHQMAEVLAAGGRYPMVDEDPRHVAESLLAVLEDLFKLRTQVRKAEGSIVRERNAEGAIITKLRLTTRGRA